MTEIYDFAIIGTGSVGSAAGYYASQKGLKVLELDVAVPPHTQGSHHGQTRLIRHAYGEGGKYLPMLLRAQKLWDELQQKTHRDIFHQISLLNVGRQGTDFIENVERSAQRYQLPDEKLTGEEISQRWRNFSFSNDYVGVLEEKAGYLNSEIAIQAYLDLAKEIGVEQKFDSAVQSIDFQDDIVVIRTAQQVYQVKNVLVSAGTWVKELLTTVPVQPIRKVFAWFDVADKRLNEDEGFPAFAIEIDDKQTYYGFPGKDDTIKIGQHTGGQPINQRSQGTPYGDYSSDKEEVLPLLQRYLKGVGPLNHGASCTYDQSPDGDFIIDQLPNQPNVQIVTGLSGHGFKFVSALGELAAQKANQEEITTDLSAFKLNRFE